MRPGHSSIVVLLALTVFGWPPSSAELPSTAGDAWIRVQTANFTLLSNTEPERTLQFGDQLERLRDVLSRVSSETNLYSPLPTTIYVFKDTASFSPYNAGPDGKPDLETAGYFLRGVDGNYMAIDASDAGSPFRVIYHEYLHYVLENSLPAIPLWLNEGIAEFYSTFEIIDGDAHIGRPIEAHIRWLTTHHLMSLDELFAIDTDSKDYNEGDRRGTFYAQSWALAHQLLVDAQMRAESGRLMHLIGRGEDSIQAFETVLGVDPIAMEKKLVEYINSGITKFFRYKPEQAFVQGEREATPLAAKEVLFYLGDLLTHRGLHQAVLAEEHLQGALALDDAYTDPQVSLARLRIAQQRYDEASALCESTIVKNPANPSARALHGMALLAQFDPESLSGEVLPKETPPLLLRAREQFAAALESRPGDVESLIGLGQTYLFQSGAVEPGIGALAEAQRARPARSDLLRALIVLTGRSGNMAGARSLLERGLRPRGNAEETRLAEIGLAHAQMQIIAPLAEAGQLGEAAKRLRELAEWIQDPTVKQEILAQSMRVAQAQEGQKFHDLRAQAVAAGAAGDAEKARELLEKAVAVVSESESREDEVALYNKAVGLLQEGKPEEAAQALDRVVGIASQPDLRERARLAAADIRAKINHSRQIELYNAAVEQFNQRAFAQASGILEPLLDEPSLNEELRESAESLLRRVRRFTENVPSPRADGSRSTGARGLSRAVWVSLFPAPERITRIAWDQCSELIDEWLGAVPTGSISSAAVDSMKDVVRETLACHPQTPFHVGGYVSQDTALMNVGIGVHPYVAITESRQLELHVAVIVPAMPGRRIEQLSFLADDELAATVPASAAFNYQYLTEAGGMTGSMALDIPQEVLGPEALRRLASAKKVVVQYGERSGERVKLAKRNLAKIEPILAAHAALSSLRGGE